MALFRTTFRGTDARRPLPSISRRTLANGDPAPLVVRCKDANSGPSSSKQLTVSITGATGFIGRRLVQRLLAGNHNVCVLTRSKSKARSVFPEQEFPGIVIAEDPEWGNCVEGSSAVVNLAGMPISTRWSPEIKKGIKQSRVDVTSKVVRLINQLDDDVRPSVFISATAVGYYGTSETKVFDERSPSGSDYLAEVCREWEARASGVDKEVRLVLIRIGVVLGKDGGALAKMIPLFNLFAGGPLGSGQQWFSWIHVDDLVNLIMEALINPSYKGVINGTAPNPVRFSEMCDHLGKVMGRPSWLPVPDFALKAVLGEGATIVWSHSYFFCFCFFFGIFLKATSAWVLQVGYRIRIKCTLVAVWVSFVNNQWLLYTRTHVLDGQKVLPLRAKELGFSYRYPYINDALKAITSDGI